MLSEDSHSSACMTSSRKQAGKHCHEFKLGLSYASFSSGPMHRTGMHDDARSSAACLVTLRSAVLVRDHVQAETRCVVACSALKRRYREVLSGVHQGSEQSSHIAFVRLQSLAVRILSCPQCKGLCM